jgi:hypothetical protein
VLRQELTGLVFVDVHCPTGIYARAIEGRHAKSRTLLLNAQRSTVNHEGRRGTRTKPRRMRRRRSGGVKPSRWSLEA